MGHLTSTLHSEFIKPNTSFLTSTSLKDYLNSPLSSQDETAIDSIFEAKIWESSLIPPSPKYHISNRQHFKLCISLAWLPSHFRQASFLISITAAFFFSAPRCGSLRCINHTALRMIFLDKNLILVRLCLKHLGFPLIPRQKDSKLLNIATCHMLLNVLTPVVWLNPMSRLSYPF